jgi:hypothetical protein
MKWVGHVACMGDIINAYRIFVGKSEWERDSEDLGVDGR